MSRFRIAAFIAVGGAVGFILAWVFRVESRLNLFTGLLLVVAGSIIGFVIEWFLDEAYRQNRELQQQLSGRSESEPLSSPPPIPPATYSEEEATVQELATSLHQREGELRQLHEQMESTRSRLEDLREEFEAYQQTHPDDLTVIKGIGSVYQRKLRDMGYNSYGSLAEADPEQLRRLLDVKEWQAVAIESWIAQARDWAERSKDG